jgi:polar amino acid transport system ATP-binding protein/arginine:pyruvate transaminase
MDRMRDAYRRRRDLVFDALAQVPELKVARPEAGMFLLVDVRGTGLTSTDFAWALFRQVGVSVLDATAFGRSAAGFVRISYSLSEDALIEGCARIRRFVAGLGESKGRRARG